MPGVLGLGAIGVRVANMAVQLGMNAIGFDTALSVHRAWELSASVAKATSIGELLAHSDVVTVHVPFSDATQHLVNAERLQEMRPGATLLNFSRDGVVDERAVNEALREGRLHAYVTDFPRAVFRDQPRAIMLPHIGASTREAEDNSARAVVDQLRLFLEDGCIANSVNFPEVDMPRTGGHRLALVNANVPNMLGQISTTLAEAGHNILDMLNRSRGDIEPPRVCRRRRRVVTGSSSVTVTGPPREAPCRAQDDGRRAANLRIAVPAAEVVQWPQRSPPARLRPARCTAAASQPCGRPICRHRATPRFACSRPVPTRQ